jgi:hypothetical protein
MAKLFPWEELKQLMEIRQAAVALGKLGGSAKTDRKAAASRANGKLGGAKRRYPVCTVGTRHRFWRGVCKCGIRQDAKGKKNADSRR